MPKRKKDDVEEFDDEAKGRPDMGYKIQPKLGLDVVPIETSKDDIEQPDLAKHENMLIPPIGSVVVMSGKTGAGKTTLLANLLTLPHFYGKSKDKPNGWFDRIFIFSPTANGDDIQRSLNIPKEHVFTDLDDAPELLEIILDSQQEKLDQAKSAADVEQFAIIFDDFIGNTKFMNSKAFQRCFYAVRHNNCTTFACTQHLKKLPKICRLQANFVFFYQGSKAAVDILIEEYAPPLYTKKEIETLVNDATREKYSFLTINNKVPWKQRFRRNLDEIIELDRLTTDDDDKTEKGDNEKGDAEETTIETTKRKKSKLRRENDTEENKEPQQSVIEEAIEEHEAPTAEEEVQDRHKQEDKEFADRVDEAMNPINREQADAVRRDLFNNEEGVAEDIDDDLSDDDLWGHIRRL